MFLSTAQSVLRVNGCCLDMWCILLVETPLCVNDCNFVDFKGPHIQITALATATSKIVHIDIQTLSKIGGQALELAP